MNKIIKEGMIIIEMTNKEADQLFDEMNDVIVNTDYLFSGPNCYFKILDLLVHPT